MARILVAEDSLTQAAELRLILEAEGFEVEVAPVGEKALEALRAPGRRAHDLLLSDVLMPGLGGYELCRRLKDDPAWRDLPVVLLTSLREPADVIRALECGADNFLTKPCEPAALVARVRAALGAAAAQRAGGLRFGAEIVFRGKKILVTSDKEQILDLLVGAFDEVLLANERLRRTQEELRAANAKIDEYARRLEGRVRSSEEKYGRLMDQAGDAILLRDLSGRILEVNRRAEELLGRPAAELVGRRVDDLVAPEDRERFRQHAGRLAASGASRTDSLRLPRPGGPPACVDWSSSVVEIGGERIVLVVAHDVTERNQREDALRRSERALWESERSLPGVHEQQPRRRLHEGRRRQLCLCKRAAEA